MDKPSLYIQFLKQYRVFGWHKNYVKLAAVNLYSFIKTYDGMYLCSGQPQAKKMIDNSGETEK